MSMYPFCHAVLLERTLFGRRYLREQKREVIQSYVEHLRRRGTKVESGEDVGGEIYTGDVLPTVPTDRSLIYKETELPKVRNEIYMFAEENLVSNEVNMKWSKRDLREGEWRPEPEREEETKEDRKDIMMELSNQFPNFHSLGGDSGVESEDIKCYSEQDIQLHLREEKIQSLEVDGEGGYPRDSRDSRDYKESTGKGKSEMENKGSAHWFKTKLKHSKVSTIFTLMDLEDIYNSEDETEYGLQIRAQLFKNTQVDHFDLHHNYEQKRLVNTKTSLTNMQVLIYIYIYI